VVFISAFMVPILQNEKMKPDAVADARKWGANDPSWPASQANRRLC
jgi:hypothetical protein